MLQFAQVLKFDNFNSKVHLGFEWIYSTDSSVPIDIWPVFEGNIIVRLFFRHGKPCIPCQSLLLSTIVLNDIVS